MDGTCILLLMSTMVGKAQRVQLRVDAAIESKVRWTIGCVKSAEMDISRGWYTQNRETRRVD